MDRQHKQREDKEGKHANHETKVKADNNKQGTGKVSKVDACLSYDEGAHGMVHGWVLEEYGRHTRPHSQSNSHRKKRLTHFICPPPSSLIIQCKVGAGTEAASSGAQQHGEGKEEEAGKDDPEVPPELRACRGVDLRQLEEMKVRPQEMPLLHYRVFPLLTPT